MTGNPQPGSDHIRPASGHVRHIGPLKPQAGEPQLTKTSHNAFTTTNLQQLLTQQGITEVIVCGIRTEQCCETTARVAFDLGCHVTFVTDATATSPIAQRDAPTGQTVGHLLADPLRLAPRVGDRLAISIYYDQRGHTFFTVTDLTRPATQTVMLYIGRLIHSAAGLWVQTDRVLSVSPPPADTRLWQFTGSRLTTYGGDHGTITGPWTTSKMITTTTGTHRAP
jgi:hypothetical protein